MFQLDIKNNRTIRVGSKGDIGLYIGLNWQNYKKSILIFTHYCKYFDPKFHYYEAKSYVSAWH